MSNNPSRARLFVVSGPSGSGKTTLLKILRAKKQFRDNLIKVITVTTRKSRQGEKNGKDYRFMERLEFLRRREKGEFIESQEIFGEYYATPKEELLKVIRNGQDALLCVDVQGALALKHIFPEETRLIFISAADVKSLRERLHLRSSESKESLKKRLSLGRAELGYIKRYDYLIVNDVVRDALRKLSAVITAERLKVPKTYYTAISTK